MCSIMFALSFADSNYVSLSLTHAFTLQQKLSRNQCSIYFDLIDKIKILRLRIPYGTKAFINMKILHGV
jgi:hypothetical protein